MNPFLLKAGVAVIAAVAIQIYFIWRSRKVEQSYSNGACGNYDGSNMKSCCICLNEFSTFLKKEVVTFPCLHKICRACCKKLFSEEIGSSKICPQCRKPIPKEILYSVT